MHPSGAIHHIDITVSDPERSLAFYDRVLPLMGFARIDDVPEGPLWAGAQVEVGLQASRPDSSSEHDRYTPGLHHLAFTAPTKQAVDEFFRKISELGVSVLDPPAAYPEYTEGYYAVFFSDPDGIKLEYVFTPQWPA